MYGAVAGGQLPHYPLSIKFNKDYFLWRTLIAFFPASLTMLTPFSNERCIAALMP